MRRFLLMLATVLMLPSLSFAQQSQWEYVGLMPRDSTHVLHTASGGHGIAVDGAGRVWIGNLQALTITVGDQTITGTRPLWVYNSDGTPADFSPLYQVTINGQTHRLGTAPDGNFTGLRTDHEGHIIANYHTRSYRINHQTREVMNVWAHGLMRTAEAAHAVNTVGVTDDGHIIASYVFGGSPIQLLDPQFNFVMNVEGERTGFARTVEVNGSGSVVYQPIYTLGGTVRYTTELFPFTDYAAQDTILRGMATESIAWDTRGYLWVSTGSKNDRPNLYDGEPTGTNFQIMNWYAWNPETEQFVDRIVWNNLAADTSGTRDPRPRGVAFSPDGQYAYVQQFGAGPVPAVQQFRFTGPTSVRQEDGLATQFSLEQNYPNPFNPTTRINFELVNAGHTSLRVFDILGREVAVLADEHLPAGRFTYTFDGANLPSGTYMYVLEQNGRRTSSLMTLLK